MCKQCYKTQKEASTKYKAAHERKRREKLGLRKVVHIWKPTRTCKVCNSELDRSLFNNTENICNGCLSKRNAKTFKDSYQTLSKRAQVLCSNARNRSKKKDVAFDLDKEWVADKLSSGVCEVTGIPFDYSNKTFAPSMDRTIPEEGYTKDNTKVVCWIYNSAKGIGTHEDVMKLAKALINER